MENLQHLNQEAQNKIMRVLKDPGVRDFAKEIICQGLERDCVDAANDARLAYDTLTGVMNSIMHHSAP